MSLLAQFLRTYRILLLVSCLTGFTAKVHAQAAPDFFWMVQPTTEKPLEANEGDFEGQKSHPETHQTTIKDDIEGKEQSTTDAYTSYEMFCSSAPRLDFAQPKDSFLGQTKFPKGARVDYTCRPGFMRIPGYQSFYAKCMNDGTWFPPGNFCIRRSCGNPGEVDNAEMAGEDFLFGSKVTYICNPGYRMITKKNYRECLADGTWSNTLPVCEVQLCPDPPRITNGVVFPIKEEYTYLDAVTYFCNKNLALIGESSISCKEDGQWSSNAPECRVVECSSPYVTNGIKTSGFSGPYIFNSVVRFMCSPGYLMKGSDIIKCNQISQWEPALPQCIGICGNIPSIYYAELIVPTTKRSFLEGTTLKFKCRAGFNPVPEANNTITCKGKSWTRFDDFCKPISCGNPGAINNGLIRFGSFFFRSVVTYACDKGYKIKNVYNRTCQSDGNWSLPIPECEVQTCPSPNITNHGSFIPLKTQFQHGDNLIHSCNEGFLLIGKPESVCNEEGKWTPALPFCVSIENICQAPPELEYAVLNTVKFYSIGTVANKDEKVSYSCKNGYTRNYQYSSTLTCWGNLEWSLPEQFCSRISCGPPERITDGEYKVEDFLFESEAIYTCKEGYKMVGNNSRKCLANGMWSNLYARCRVQTCPPPEDLDDGSYSIKKQRYIYGDLVTYKCNSLTLVGEASVSCTAKGSWTYGAPVCKAVCKSPPELNYGEFELVNPQDQYFNIGKSLKYKCRPGYISASNKSFVITCQEDLKWSEPKVVCTRRSCENPGDIAHGEMHFENFLFESRVTYTCKSGYNMISRSSYRTCQADGTWSGTPPVCKASICDNIWELQEEARRCTSTPDEWIKYLQVQYLYLQIENLKLDIEIKKKKLSAEKVIPKREEEAY